MNSLSWNQYTLTITKPFEFTNYVINLWKAGEQIITNATTTNFAFPFPSPAARANGFCIGSSNGWHETGKWPASSMSLRPLIMT